MKATQKARLMRSLKTLSSYYNGFVPALLKKSIHWTDDPDSAPFNHKKNSLGTINLNGVKTGMSFELSLCDKCLLNGSEPPLPFPSLMKGKPAIITASPLSGEERVLLDKMLSSIGLVDKKNCIVLSLARCPLAKGEIAPKKSIVDACRPSLDAYLKEQDPPLILAMGKYAGMFLTGREIPLLYLRQKAQLYNNKERVWTTYSSEDLLLDPTKKRFAWNDLKRFQSLLKSVAIIKD